MPPFGEANTDGMMNRQAPGTYFPLTAANAIDDAGRGR